MVFQPGKSGNPDGSRGKKPFLDALNAILTMEWDGIVPDLPKKSTVAHAMAHKLVSGSMRSDWKPSESLAYIQEICDRAYGKSQASISVDHSGAIAIFTADISPTYGFISSFAVPGGDPALQEPMQDGPVLLAPIRT